MSLSTELVSQLVKATSDSETPKTATTVYATVVEQEGTRYVKLDGSEQLTPVSTTTTAKNGERVLVQIQNHTAIIVGNISSPSASNKDLNDLSSQVVSLGRVTAESLDAERAKISELQADNVVIKKSLAASEADISSIKANNVTISAKLTATEADISKLQTDKLDAATADITYATIDKLDATSADIRDLEATYGEFEKLATDKFTAIDADISSIKAENVTIEGKLTATEADISKLQTDKLDATSADLKYATITKLDAAEAEIDELIAGIGEFEQLVTDDLTAVKADISSLETDKLDVATAEITYASIGSMNAAVADIENLTADHASFKTATTNKLTAIDADISNLETDKLSAKDAEITYANIDFSNIGKAAIEHFYATSGLIEDIVVGDGTITGKLVGVTISGDLIEGNTIKADKLVVKGDDGLYYKLNVEAGVTTSDQVTKDDLSNGLSGSVIITNTITAEKINVRDLVAFDATIGGFNITDNSIYSGIKESATNTTRGVHMDSSGQFAVGDSTNHIMYFKDSNGAYKLVISASSITLSATAKTLEDTLTDIQDEFTAKIDAIEIGARNLIRNSKTLIFDNYNFLDSTEGG